jgi:MFS family permease
MVFLGRILDGLTAGNLSTAQAYISDHTRPENRAKAFGVIGIAFGIGFFFGPAMAGWLQQYGLHVPFLVAAGLSAGSMICTYTLLEPGVPGVQESGTAAQSDAPGAGTKRVPDRAGGSQESAGLPDHAPANGPGGKRPALFDLATYLAYFKRPGLGALYVQFFLFCFSFSAFMSGFALFAERRFTTSDGRAWTAHEVGFLFAYTGFLGIVLQGGILGRLVKRFGEARLALAGFIATVVAYLVLGIAETVLLLVVVSTIAAFGNGVLRPVITSLITQGVGRHEQGVAIGISGSLNSLAMTLAPPAGGSLIDQHWLVAWALVPATAAALGLITALVSRSKGTGTASNARPSDPSADVRDDRHATNASTRERAH